MQFTWKHGGFLGLVLLGLLGGFTWQSKRQLPSSSSSSPRAVEKEAAREDAALLTSSHSRLEPAPSERSVEQSEQLAEHREEEEEHPHPVTPEHERIFAENRTIQALNDSMALRDVSKMRELLSEYQRLDPQDIEATQAGYAVVADCIESPGSASLAAASRFYDTQRHSPLRRFVRRICFENSD